MAIVIGGALCSLAIGGAFLAHYLISNESQRAKYSSFDFAGNLRRLNALTRLQGLADIVCAAVLLAGLICLVAGIVVYVRSRLRPAPRVQGPSDAAQEMVLCRCPHCNTALGSTMAEGQADTCPACGEGFIVAASVERRRVWPGLLFVLLVILGGIGAGVLLFQATGRKSKSPLHETAEAPSVSQQAEAPPLEVPLLLPTRRIKPSKVEITPSVLGGYIIRTVEAGTMTLTRDGRAALVTPGTECVIKGPLSVADCIVCPDSPDGAGFRVVAGEGLLHVAGSATVWEDGVAKHVRASQGMPPRLSPRDATAGPQDASLESEAERLRKAATEGQPLSPAEGLGVFGKNARVKFEHGGPIFGLGTGVVERRRYRSEAGQVQELGVGEFYSEDKTREWTREYRIRLLERTITADRQVMAESWQSPTGSPPTRRAGSPVACEKRWSYLLLANGSIPSLWLKPGSVQRAGRVWLIPEGFSAAARGDLHQSIQGPGNQTQTCRAHILAIQPSDTSVDDSHWTCTGSIWSAVSPFSRGTAADTSPAK